MKHMDRRWGLVCFRKGAGGDMSCDCTTVEMSAKNVMKLPNSDRWLITPDPENPGHYMTFRQLSKALASSSPDQHMKSVMNTSCGKYRYVFTSESDQKKHIELVHGGSGAWKLRHNQAVQRKRKCTSVHCVRSTIRRGTN